MFSRFSLVLGLVLSLMGGSVFAAAKPNTLDKKEKAAGWKLLFDGKTLQGWRGFSKPEVSPNWKVIDGLLTRADKGDDLMTLDEYDNFDFQFDWKLEQGGNSGVMYRVQTSQKVPYLTGPEYQLLDDERHADAHEGKDGNRKSGAIYDVYPPAKAVVKPAGEWNHSRIVVNGNHVEHWLNGVKVVEAEIGSADWNSRVAASKWKSATEYAKYPKGHIDFQDHGAKLELRNIKVLELKAAVDHSGKK